jgi:hypothetical protein
VLPVDDDELYGLKENAEHLLRSGGDAKIELVSEIISGLVDALRAQHQTICYLADIVKSHEDQIAEYEERIDKLELHYWEIPPGYKLLGRGRMGGYEWQWIRQGAHLHQPPLEYSPWFSTEIDCRHNLKERMLREATVDGTE